MCFNRCAPGPGRSRPVRGQQMVLFVVRAKPWAAATINSEKLPCLGAWEYFVCESVLCV